MEIFVDGCCFMCYYTECHQKTVIVGSNRDYNEKKNVHGTGGRAHRSQYGGGSRKRRTENTEWNLGTESTCGRNTSDRCRTDPGYRTDYHRGSSGGTGWRDGGSQSTGRGVGSGGCPGRRSFRRGYDRRWICVVSDRQCDELRQCPDRTEHRQCRSGQNLWRSGGTDPGCGRRGSGLVPDHLR